MKRGLLFSGFLLGVILITACQPTDQPTSQSQQQVQQQNPSYISKQQAEQSALDFSRLFDADEGVNKIIQTSYREGPVWTVVIIVEYVQGEVSEGTQLTIDIDAVTGTINCFKYHGEEKLCGEVPQFR